VPGTLLTDLFNLAKLCKMDCIIQDIPRLSREALHALQALFPQFEEKLFKFDLTTSHQDRTIVWFLRPHDRRRYALTLGWNGFLRLRRYDSNDTRVTIFQSEHHNPEDFDDLLDAFSRSESEWSGYEIELEPDCSALS
jgi:hypothetical protein